MSGLEREFGNDDGRRKIIIIAIVITVLVVGAIIGIIVGTTAGKQSRTTKTYNCTGNPCTPNRVFASPIQGFQFMSPDGTKFFVNKIDNATNKSQIYVGTIGA